MSEAELNGAIVGMAQRQNQRPEALRDHLIRTGQINALYQQVMEQKALDAIVAAAKVEDVSTEAWNDYAKQLNDAGVTAGEDAAS